MAEGQVNVFAVVVGDEDGREILESHAAKVSNIQPRRAECLLSDKTW